MQRALAPHLGGVVRDTAARQVIREVLEVQIASQGGELDEFEYRTDKSGVVVVATMRSVHPLDQATVDTTATALSGRLGARPSGDRLGRGGDGG